MFRIQFLLCLAIFSLVIVSCESAPSIPTGEMPDISIPANEINKRVKVEAPRSLNNFKIGEGVDLTVELISDDEVAFPHDYGAKMFVYENNQWVEVENFMDYPEGYQVLSTKGDNPFGKYGAPAVDPILPDMNKAVTVRIFLVGNIYRDGEVTDEKTAAYIDVVLKP